MKIPQMSLNNYKKQTCSTTGNTVKHGYNEHAKLLIPGTSL